MSEKYEGKIESREFLPNQNDSGVGISGRWLNKRNGQMINIRNSVMDGDNMIIITDKGQISMTEFSRDYIQASDDIYDETGKIIGHEEVKHEDYAENPDWLQIQEMINTPHMHNVNQHKQPVINTNEQIIKKVFDKLTTYPKINVDIKWDDFPEAQMQTLVNFLDISIDDISKYIIKNYVNVEALALEITEILKSKLNKNIEE